MTTRTMSRYEASAPIDGIDFGPMYAAHDAFERDLRRLTAAAAAGTSGEPAVRTGWETFKRQLHIHHTAEDEALWPPLRERVAGRPDALAVLDAMEAEHGRIDPLLSRVDASLAEGDILVLRTAAKELSDQLSAHLDHEEEQALPLVAAELGAPGWAAFGQWLRKRQGLSGAAEFFPWLLDDAPQRTRVGMMAMLPPPARVLHRFVWRRRYAGSPRWA
jgi:Hemerythrin HHE cation binding domain